MELIAVIADIGHVHAHQHVAGHEAARHGDLLAAADLDHVLFGHQNLFDDLLETLFGHGGADLFSHTLFEVDSTLTEYHRFAISLAFLRVSARRPRFFVPVSMP